MDAVTKAWYLRTCKVVATLLSFSIVALWSLYGPDKKLEVGWGGGYFQVMFLKKIFYTIENHQLVLKLWGPLLFCSLLQAYFIFSRMVLGNFKFLSNSFCKNWEISKAFTFFFHKMEISNFIFSTTPAKELIIEQYFGSSKWWMTWEKCCLNTLINCDNGAGHFFFRKRRLILPLQVHTA